MAKDKVDAGWKIVKDVASSPMALGAATVFCYAANRFVNGARNKALVKSVVNFVDNGVDGIVKAIPDSK